MIWDDEKPTIAMAIAAATRAANAANLNVGDSEIEVIATAVAKALRGPEGFQLGFDMAEAMYGN